MSNRHWHIYPESKNQIKLKTRFGLGWILEKGFLELKKQNWIENLMGAWIPRFSFIIIKYFKILFITQITQKRVAWIFLSHNNILTNNDFIIFLKQKLYIVQISRVTRTDPSYYYILTKTRSRSAQPRGFFFHLFLYKFFFFQF